MIPKIKGKLKTEKLNATRYKPGINNQPKNQFSIMSDKALYIYNFIHFCYNSVLFFKITFNSYVYTT